MKDESGWMKWATCGSLRFDHFEEAAAGLLWCGWGPGMVNRDRIASAVSLSLDSGLSFALTPAGDRVLRRGSAFLAISD